MRKIAAVVLMAVSMAFGVSVYAGAHGTVSADAFAPQKVNDDVIKARGFITYPRYQHADVVVFFTLQKKIGSNPYVNIHSTTRSCNNCSGIDATPQFNCYDTPLGKGSATYRLKISGTFKNDQGDIAHSPGPFYSGGNTIASSYCYDDD